MNVPNKALAAGAGSGVGGSIATLILALWWPNADPSSAAAVATLCSAVVSMIGAYATPHNPAS